VLVIIRKFKDWDVKFGKVRQRNKKNANFGKGKLFLDFKLSTFSEC
jgi:hypothetical protein